MFDIISLIGVANSINIRLRVTASEGVILFVGGDNEDALSTDYLLIGVDRGYLQVHVQILESFWFSCWADDHWTKLFSNVLESLIRKFLFFY